ncbi:MAG: site-2 protease family protein [Archaeoglobus sp.]|nr:site-2 protease family protein [Archaeoglobus sp.]
MISQNWMLGLGIFLVYWVVVTILKSKKKLEKYNITAYGPILLIRTEKGLNFLDRISRNKAFWRRIADSGVPAVFAGMAFMFILILIMDFVLFTNPPPPSELTNPKNALLIPGLNDWIPLEWGIIGLLVTLVVHEFSHGILCRVEGVRVKSMGVILALVPIGGFAEPDEEELLDKNKTRRIQRIRIFSAGVISNFIVAFFAFALFFYLISALSPTVTVLGVYPDSPAYGVVEELSIVKEINGVKVVYPEDVDKAIKSDILRITVEKNGETKTVELENLAGPRIVGLIKGYPALDAGLKEGMIIYSINGIRTYSISSFFNVMKKTKPGDGVDVVVFYQNEFKHYSFQLGKHPSGNTGFMGVSVEDQISGMRIAYSSLILDWLRSIPSQLSSPRGWLTIISMPINFRGFGEESSAFFIPQGFWKDKGETIFYILNILYWVGWIDFYVGLFNCLPAIPLDGGRVLHETLSSILTRRFGERGEEMSLAAGRFLAFIVFSSLLLSILIPNLQGLIGG